MADNIVLPTTQDTDAAFNEAFSDKNLNPAAAPAQIPVAAQQPMAPEMAVPTEPVNVINPEGKLVSIPGHQLQDAINSGYKPASPEEVHSFTQEQKYGDQKLITGLEGAASAATFGASTAAEEALGVDPEDIRGRRETNPGSHMAGQVGGLLGSSLLVPGGGAAGILEKAGAGAAKAVGLGAAETTVAKVGSAIVKQAIENSLFQAGDEVSKMISADPNQSAETAIADIGLSGLLGGVIGGAVGSANPLWQATFGKKTGGVLKALTDKLGGVEGQESNAINDMVQRSGMDLSPEVKARLSSDPAIQQIAKTLEQSDTTGSGLKFQESMNKAREQASDSIVRSLGKEPAEVLKAPELSPYEAGKSIGKTLADEYHAQLDPISKEYDDLYTRYKSVELDPNKGEKLPSIEAEQAKKINELEKLGRQAQKAMKSGDPEAAIQAAAKLEEVQAEVNALSKQLKAPGSTDVIVDKIGQLASKEGWTASPSSDIMREVNRVIKEVPELKNLNDLGNYIKAVGNNMQSDPLNGAMTRAGGMIKGILKDVEADIIGRNVGSEEGVDAVARYTQVRKAYAAQSSLKEALDSRLHARGSTSGYAKALREMAQTDGETLLRRLSSDGDADMLNILQQKFPATAQKVREYNINKIVQQAINKAKPGEEINGKEILRQINKMSPELKNFVLPGDALPKIEAVSSILEHFEKLPHNFSNTARTADKLGEWGMGSAMGLITMLTGHGPLAAGVVTLLTKALGKDAPDAARLALLKFLGSEKEISSTGFKAAVDYIHATAKGESAVARASKNLFKAAAPVLPEGAMPSEASRNKLDKQLKALQKDQQSMLDSHTGEVGHYMPEHAVALGQVSAAAVQYLNSLRPNEEKNLPFDGKPKSSPAAKSAYNRALDIAQQPLVVLQAVKDGRVTAQDLLTLKNLYPALYSKLANNVSSEMINSASKDQPIPYKTRLGLSMFLGQPLDSTMTSAAIASAQPQAMQQAQQQQMAADGQGPKHSMNALNKLPGAYLTPEQSRQVARAKNH